MPRGEIMSGKTWNIGEWDDKNIFDPFFKDHESISVSPVTYDPNIQTEICGDPIAVHLSSPMSIVLPDESLSISSAK